MIKLLRFKRVHHPIQLPSIWQIIRKAAALLWRCRWICLWLIFINILLNVLFAGGFGSGSNASDISKQLQQGLQGNSTQLAAGTAGVSTLLTLGSSSTQTQAVYQLVFLVIMSLAIIWVLRNGSAGEKMRMSDPFYKGMYPLIPYIIICIIVILQAVPFIAGAAIYNIVTSYGIAITASEKFIWGMLFAGLTCISLFFISSSIFAGYVVTLPGGTPRKALKQAKKLVHYRRFSVIRKLLFLPILLISVGVVLLFPVLLLFPAASTVALDVAGLVVLMVAHAYLYSLYKELLVV